MVWADNKDMDQHAHSRTVLFAAVNRFSLEIEKPVHLWLGCAHDFFFVITIFIVLTLNVLLLPNHRPI